MGERKDRTGKKEIERVVRNFNAKVRRLEKKGHEIVPEKVNKDEIMKYTRSGIRSRLKELKKFSERGIEEVIRTKGGVKTTKYEHEILKSRIKGAKQSIRSEMKTYETKGYQTFGKKEIGTVAMMGSGKYYELRNTYRALGRKPEVIGRQEYNYFKNYVRRVTANRRRGNEQFKINFVEIIHRMGIQYGYNPEKLKEIEKQLLTVPESKFYQLYQIERSLKSILDYYPLVTGDITGIRPGEISGDVIDLFENLYNVIGDIVKDYQ